MNFLIYTLIFSIINLNNLYIFSYKLNFIRLFSVFFILYIFLRPFSLDRLTRTTKVLFKWAFLFITFKFILYVTIHFDHDIEPFYEFLKELFVILLLPAIEISGFKKISKAILICAVPSILLGILQIINPNVNLDTIIPHNPIIFTQQITQSYLLNESRIVGTYNLSIGLALLIGFLCIIICSNIVADKKKLKLMYFSIFCLLHFLVIFTQTRSAIYGIVPSIIIAFLLSERKRIKKISITLFLVIICTACFGIFTVFVVKYSERSIIRMDSNTYYKITANIYGVYGSLSQNPLFGIRKSKEISDSRDKYLRDYKRDMELLRKAKQDLGDFLKTKDFSKIMQTHHNLFAFYLRYYGIIGFGFLFFIMVLMYKKINVKIDHSTKFMLFGIVFYFIQFSMFHNTKLLQCELLWLLIAQGTEHAANIRDNERLQWREQLKRLD